MATDEQKKGLAGRAGLPSGGGLSSLLETGLGGAGVSRGSLGDVLGGTSGGLLNALATLAGNRPMTGLYFNRKAVVLDGYKFSGCRFDGCRLTVSTTNFELDHCIIDDKSVIEYGADVIKVIKLFNTRFASAYESMPAFAPVRHPDGTISINSNPTVR